MHAASSRRFSLTRCKGALNMQRDLDDDEGRSASAFAPLALPHRQGDFDLICFFFGTQPVPI
jgi:hypothetical protein